MIDLITGTPGAGKSLFAISTVKAKAEKENRPVFYSGIADLTLPWTEIDPEKWFECPPNSIIVLDECQRLFRPRANGGKVPDYVSELETHRHKGLDLVFITQHPMLIDSNVRRLVGKHFHVSRRFGFNRSSIFEFESCKDQPLSKVSNATARLEWSYPKEAFTWYKSAEVHTVKRRIPAKYFVVIFALVVVIASVWWFVNRWSHKIKGDDPSIVSVAGKNSASVAAVPKLNYYESRLPRIDGLPSSAPVYDKVTEPTSAPMPVACIASKSKCACSSQQGTRIETSDYLCRQIVSNGYYVDWQEKRNYEPPAKSVRTDRRRDDRDSEQVEPSLKPHSTDLSSDSPADWHFKGAKTHDNEV